MNCPRCGRSAPDEDLQRFSGVCLGCAYAFASEDDPPEIPNLDVLATIGKGGMGVVYKAVQKHLGRTVALKVLAPRLLDDATFADRILREAKTLAQLSHPHIVAVHDAGVHVGMPYLIMEFVEGQSLRRLLAGSKLDPDRAARIAAQVCDALEYAHGRGVIHRDIKPENILIDRDGNVKVADFGLARLDTEPRLTRSNFAMGTPSYMAPEQIETPSKIDARTDLYALGVVYYEMLTGTLPIGRFKPPGVADAIILKLLETDPGRRFASAAELRVRLTTRPSRRGWIAAAVAAVVLAAGGVALKMAVPSPIYEWVELGGSASGGGVSRTPGPSGWCSLAADASDRVVAAWDDGSPGTPKIYLRRWEGKEWRELDGSASGPGLSPGTGRSQQPRLALDAQGNPFAVWRDEGSGRFQIYLRRWTGKHWEELGGSATGGGVSRSPSVAWAGDVAVDRQGHPFVAWHDGAPGRWQVYLRRWDGAQWGELGGSASGSGVSQSPGTSFFPTIALDPSGRPVVAWHEVTGDRHAVLVRCWEGERWRDLGSPAAGGASGWEPDVGGLHVQVDAQGLPVLAWVDKSARQVHVRRWSGTAWEDVGAGDVARTGGADVFVSLALDAHGRPVVAWMDNSLASHEVYLRRWDGAAWVELGVSASGAGVSRSATGEAPAVIVDAAGDPIVGWHDVYQGAQRICLRRWTAVK